MRRWSGLPGIRIWLVVVLVLTSVWSFFPQGAHAGTVLLRTIVRLDNMNESTGTTGSVCIQPANTATITQISVTFPTGFVVSSTSGNWTTSQAVPGVLRAAKTTGRRALRRSAGRWLMRALRGRPLISR